VPLEDVVLATETPPEQLLALNAALDRFAAIDPLKAELVKLRFFAGLSEEETAAAMGISRATASRYWTYARAWLINALDEKTE
jgi:RNA polymerase sigma factor (sigma-70 family)